MGFGNTNAVSIAFEGKDNVSPVVRGIKSSMDKFKRDASTGFGIAAGFNVATAAMNVGKQALGAVVDGIGEAVQKASALAEATSKVDNVFHGSAEQIHEWAKTTTDSFGISQLAAERFAGNFGNLFTAFGVGEQAAADMSSALVELAADLASFNDTGIEEALAAIQSGLAGEMEPMKRFGAILTVERINAQAYADGIAEIGAKLTIAQKAQATYNLIMKDTANAQGDFARTSDGLANQQRILDAKLEDLTTNLGKGLLPVTLSFVTALNDVATAIGWLVSPTSDASVDRLKAKFDELTGSVEEAQVASEGDWFLSGTVFDSAVDGLNALQGAINESPLGPAWLKEVNAMEDALSGYAKLLEWTSTELYAVSRAAVDAGLSIEEVRDLVASDFWNNVVKWDERPDVAKRAESTGKTIWTDLANGLTVGIYTAAEATSGDIDTAMSEAFDNWLGGGLDFMDTVFGGGGSAFGSNKRFFKPNNKGKVASFIMKDLRAQIQVIKNNIRDLRKHPQLMGNIQEELNGLHTFIQQKIDNNPDNAGLQMYAGLSLENLEIDQAGLEGAFGAAALASGKSFAEQFDGQIPPYLRAMLEGKLTTFGVTATMNVQVNDAAWQAWANTYAPRPGGLDGDVATPWPRAMGGDIGPGRAYLVGERGPEIVRIGRRGGSVTPNHAMGGGSMDGVAVYLDGRLVGRLIDERLGRAYGGPRGSY